MEAVRSKIEPLWIRQVLPATDAAGCAAVYAPSVLEGIASFEEVAPDQAEMRRRIEGLVQTHPWLVAETAGRIVGFAYAGPHHQRSAYRWTANASVYVSPGHQRRGLGRALYGELFARLTGQGLYEVCAGISLPNPASVALHESLGFVAVGVYRDVGFKHGAWRSVGWWQRSLQPRPAGVPPEPGPPVHLARDGGAQPGPA